MPTATCSSSRMRRRRRQGLRVTVYRRADRNRHERCQRSEGPRDRSQRRSLRRQPWRRNRDAVRHAILAATASTTSAGILTPYAIAVDANGTFFVGNYGAGTLTSYIAPYAVVAHSTSTGISGPDGIAIDNANDDVRPSGSPYGIDSFGARALIGVMPRQRRGKRPAVPSLFGLAHPAIAARDLSRPDDIEQQQNEVRNGHGYQEKQRSVRLNGGQESVSLEHVDDTFCLSPSLLAASIRNRDLTIRKPRLRSR